MASWLVGRLVGLILVDSCYWSVVLALFIARFWAMRRWLSCFFSRVGVRRQPAVYAKTFIFLVLLR